MCVHAAKLNQEESKWPKISTMKLKVLKIRAKILSFSLDPDRDPARVGKIHEDQS